MDHLDGTAILSSLDPLLLWVWKDLVGCVVKQDGEFLSRPCTNPIPSPVFVTIQLLAAQSHKNSNPILHVAAIGYDVVQSRLATSTSIPCVNTTSTPPVNPNESKIQLDEIDNQTTNHHNHQYNICAS
jgi:hypothetical protein